MRRNLLKALVGILCLAFILLAAFIFMPRRYQVPPFHPEEHFHYWELPTGSKIGYTVIKAKDSTPKPPMLYLHGGPGGRVSNSIIRLLSPLAQQGHDIYLYDQIGSGHSDRLENIQEYTVQRHTRDLKAIIDLIGAQKVILFGHSWGTLLATEFYSMYPERVDRMIFSGPGPILPVNRNMGSLEAPDSLNLVRPAFSNQQANKSTQTLRSKAVFYWANIFNSKLASDQEADQFFTVLNQQLSRSTTCNGSKLPEYHPGGGYYAHIMTVKSFRSVPDKRSKIKGNDTPLLIIKGQCDNQQWGYTQEYLELFANSELRIINDAGHKMEDHRQKVYLDLINEFLMRDSNNFDQNAISH